MKLPIVVVKEPSGSYSAGFLDLPGCITSGDDPEDLMDGMQDAVETWMHGRDSSEFPGKASTLAEALEHEYANDGAIVFVDIDTSFLDETAVKANLTIPAWKLAKIDKAVEKSDVDKDNRSKFMTRAALDYAARMGLNN
ncbi:type II toxin-antitoxin system HicB family antitoxin [Maridesulfovibrio ferrireducens]|uniref:type II toxin-antitoxin system HicB family antitoxin n=1 Tax=Maridesulfovibrio ferrireducens TaxID=246191 RepID=UPI001A31CE71|nr:type II toxin-antitoxin system HicB family antitoxin [Maridesulfovibrio ferrireducens]MBI9110273.1 type II toxin-antitoxin system HicB family antitoxin [Maridesulfovibrio ferrireducens]